MHGIVSAKCMTRCNIILHSSLIIEQFGDYILIEPLRPSEVMDRIREIVRFGDVQTTSHCRRRMIGRSFHFQDLLSVLLNGEVKDQPEYDEKHDHFKYKVYGSTIDGDSAIAVTVILTFRSLMVITIFEGADLESL